MLPYDEIPLYLGEEHDCSYLAGLRARSIFFDPVIEPPPALYAALVDQGFRRSGPYLYRPNCPRCDACVPLRLPVDRFAPSRSDRRNLRLNADLTVGEHDPAFSEEYFDLYRRYQAGRHPGGGMDEPAEEEFLDFLDAPWSPTRFYEFRLDGRLLAVAVSDRLERGLSAVYTFYEPELPQRGLGRHAVLRQVAEARRLGLPYLYLGYWIEASPKMAYKARYQGVEGYWRGEWRPLSELHPLCYGENS